MRFTNGFWLLRPGVSLFPAVQQIAKEVFSAEVFVPEPAEYVALGAAKQAADLLTQE